MSKPSLMADTNDVFDQKPSNKYWVDVQVGRTGGMGGRRSGGLAWLPSWCAGQAVHAACCLAVSAAAC